VFYAQILLLVLVAYKNLYFQRQQMELIVFLIIQFSIVYNPKIQFVQVVAKDTYYQIIMELKNVFNHHKH